MEVSNRLTLTLAVSVLILQGCAETSGARMDTSQVTRASTQTVSVASDSKPTVAALPVSEGKPVIAADTKDNFEAVAAAVRQEMQPGGRFAFVSNEGRKTVDGKLIDMAALFNEFGSVDKMDPAAKGRLLGDQNSINAVLARYDSNRRVCWQETPIGTHFPKTVCRTLGEIQNQKNGSQQHLEQMRQIQRQISPAPGVGPGH